MTKRVTRVFIDGDNCAKLVREYLVQKALGEEIELFFVSNGVAKVDWSKSEQGAVHIVTTESIQSATDKWILQNIALGDIVITRDVLFAAKVVERGVGVMNDRGVVFGVNNIKIFTKERNFNMQLATLGLVNNKKTVYNKDDIKNFVKAFEKVCV